MDIFLLNRLLAPHNLEARDLSEGLDAPPSSEVSAISVGPIHVGRWEDERRWEDEIPGVRDHFSGNVRLWRVITEGRTTDDAWRRFCRLRNINLEAMAA